MVTRCLALALCAILVTPASAQNPLPSTQRLTCADAMALVRDRRSLWINPGNAAAERFVRDRSQCNLTEIAELRFVPTRDNPECPIGYRCREPDFGDWDW
ncbi:hypothetical protein [Methylobacterium sp. Leaf113]|uniref:hypothetical protein n=1 Tax=Methylobacterium sp. Leaf113 TaxID=1736259 RepID=UPI003FCE9587